MSEIVSSSSGGLAASQPRASLSEDIVQASAEAVLSVIPVVGSVLQSTFASAANIVAGRRTEAWLADLATEVDRLARELGRTVEQVVEDPAFYEALVRGTRAAQATISKEKLAALRAVVIRSGTWSPTPTLVQQICLRLVAELEPEHLALLELFAHPREWLDRNPDFDDNSDIRLGDVIPTIIQLPGEGSADWVAMRFMDELYQRGLMSQAVGLGYPIQTVRAVDTSITPLGRALMDMIMETAEV